MQWTWVDSTAIRRIGYDSRTSELGIEFSETGDIYIYLEVPPQEYEAFMAAESKGEYLNKVFKPRGYSFRILKAA